MRKNFINTSSIDNDNNNASKVPQQHDELLKGRLYIINDPVFIKEADTFESIFKISRKTSYICSLVNNDLMAKPPKSAVTNAMEERVSITSDGRTLNKSWNLKN
ncbi:hypothetical protein HPP92_017416 [Vanilla planifolia]|uniref:Uncharacterized protein n=1 Tax=Vanilla planifolia TaxID=51239 RepID=A0A835QB31_VANPL|nr:hypothetical protein HPP92_017416 [Vanilla planifolia]